MRTVTAADANRYFSKLLRDVKAGETVVVTSRGQAVATIAPVKPVDADRVDLEEGWRDLLEHLRTRPVLKLGRFDRDELYDE